MMNSAMEKNILISFLKNWPFLWTREWINSSYDGFTLVPMIFIYSVRRLLFIQFIANLYYPYDDNIIEVN